MANGVYIPMSGAVAAQRHLNLVANNLANANTTGYKQLRPAFQEFLVRAAKTPATDKGFTAMTLTQVDNAVGPLQHTGNALDVAIDGPGFFLVQDGEETLATRAGNFRVRPDGVMVDGSGLPVLGGDPTAGPSPINVRPGGGTVSINQDGEVFQDGTNIARLALVTSDTITPRGDSHYRMEGEARAVDGPRLAPGYLEGSNVNIIRGMVELIEVSRAFETQHKLMSQYRELDRRTQDIAR